jgi:hypothetical protein
MHAGFSFSYSSISVLLRQPLSIKKSYAGAIQSLTSVSIFSVCCYSIVSISMVKTVSFNWFESTLPSHATHCLASCLSGADANWSA